MSSRAVIVAIALAVSACSGSPPPKAPENVSETADATAEAIAWVKEGDAKLKLGGEDNQKAARDLFQRACAAEHAEGCTALAYIVRDGLTGERIADSFDWFSKGCSLGDAAACGAAGAHLVLDNKRDEGIALLRESCDQGNGRACMILSGVLAEGADSKTAFARAQELLESGCKTTGRYCGHLADAYRSGVGVEQDLDKALALYQKGCSNDDGRSCVVVGQYHLAGAAGAASSADTAKEVFAKACRGGNGDGCAFAGMVLIRDNAEAAAKQFDRGCQLGSGRACVLFAGHSGLEPGLAREKLHRRGCQLRYPPGCLFAGTGLLQGVGDEVKADPKQALVYFDTGCVELLPVCEDGICRDGVRDSCHNAGTMYAIGMGTKGDRETAKKRYRVACDLGGNEQACHNADH